MNDIFISKSSENVEKLLKDLNCKNFEEYQHLHAKKELPTETFINNPIPKIDKLNLKIDLSKYKKKKDPEYVYNRTYGLMKKFYLEKNFISLIDLFSNYYIEKADLAGYLVYSYNFYKFETIHEYINARIIFGINNIGFYATVQDGTQLNEEKIIDWHLFSGFSGLPFNEWSESFIEIK